MGSAAAANRAAAATAAGNRWLQVIDEARFRKNIWLLALSAGEPVAYEKEVIQSSEFDLRVDGITQEESVQRQEVHGRSKKASRQAQG